MKLIGNYLSPYVRRVAVSLNAMEMPFEFEEVFIFKSPETVRIYNPYSFTRTVRPALGIAKRVPDFARFVDRSEALEIFKACPIPRQQ